MTSIHRRLIRSQMRRDGTLSMWNEPWEMGLTLEGLMALPPAECLSKDDDDLDRPPRRPETKR